MNVLVFGKSGQVAKELSRFGSDQAFSMNFIDRKIADLLYPDNCEKIILSKKPDAVINAAAWTSVDEAETFENEASIVNGESPGAMARACKILSIPFLHISSDYVFDGSGESSWLPNDVVNPISAYGRSKLLGEKLIVESGARSIIMRTSWVFSSHGSNFVKTMLRLGNERDKINVVGDQIGGPTSASSIAKSVLILIDGLLNGKDGGIIHFSGEPDVSWAEFARLIFEMAGLNCKINSIKSKDYQTPASRPLNSRLKDPELNSYGIYRPNWKDDLKSVLNELRE